MIGLTNFLLGIKSCRVFQESVLNGILMLTKINCTAEYKGANMASVEVSLTFSENGKHKHRNIDRHTHRGDYRVCPRLKVLKNLSLDACHNEIKIKIGIQFISQKQ